MDMLLAILLWIGCIFAPNTYTTTEIDGYATQNEPVITSVMASQEQQTDIWNQYGLVVATIHVIDPFN